MSDLSAAPPERKSVYTLWTKIAWDMSTYQAFLEQKAQLSGQYGFDPFWLPDFLFDFQRLLLEWAIRKGRAAIFADCGLGKTPMQLVWAENIIRHTNQPVLIITPLAVGAQTVREAEKFGIQAAISRDGTPHPNITITNYERLHYFRPEDFIGVVCDESSAIKNFEGSHRALVTEFLRTRPYRLLCTATASPNDFIELGTSSEALGELGYMDMLGRFFKNDQNSLHPTSGRGRFERGLLTQNKWRFKPHAEIPFWRWVCSWARALRRPSDLGCADGPFILPPLREQEHLIQARKPRADCLFDLPAVGLKEQRDERCRTITERCEKVATLIGKRQTAIAWCHLNAEGDLLERLIPGAVQVSGDDADEVKEDRLSAFVNGHARVLVTKPVCAGFGLNFQHCAKMTMFPSHSFEQYYQSIRRCWRFGQTRSVEVDMITTPGEAAVLANVQRKAAAAGQMFDRLVTYMHDAQTISTSRNGHQPMRIPRWLS